MAILGILLGITMTVLTGVAYGAFCLEKTIKAAIKDLTDRVELLERRKALLAEAVTPANKTYINPGQKLRTWNEDAPIKEVNVR